MSWQIPVKTDHMKKQSSHMPSMEYAKDIYRVASRLNKPVALEIGGAWGFSTLAILEAGAKSLETVDPNIMLEAANEAEANEYRNHIWNCARSEIYWQENSNTFDLIYVDGSHLYKDISNDLVRAWERTNKGGLLMVDDWDHPNNIKAEGEVSEYGVSLACWEFWRDNPCEAGIDGRVLWFKKC